MWSFFHYCDVKETSFYYFCNTKLCAKYKKKNICEFYLFCWNHVCKVSEWCLVDFFHFEFMNSTQIMVHGYYMAKCKKFSACSRLLMVFLTFFLWFRLYMVIWTLYRRFCGKNLIFFLVLNRLYSLLSSMINNHLIVSVEKAQWQKTANQINKKDEGFAFLISFNTFVTFLHLKLSF